MPSRNRPANGTISVQGDKEQAGGRPKLGWASLQLPYLDAFEAVAGGGSHVARETAAIRLMVDAGILKRGVFQATIVRLEHVVAVGLGMVRKISAYRLGGYIGVIAAACATTPLAYRAGHAQDRRPWLIFAACFRLPRVVRRVMHFQRGADGLSQILAERLFP